MGDIDKQGEGLEGLEAEWLGTGAADFYEDDDEGPSEAAEVEEGAYKVLSLHVLASALRRSQPCRAQDAGPLCGNTLRFVTVKVPSSA